MKQNQDFLLRVSQLFVDNGPKAVTMDDVAAAVGISKKTLYQHFRNKEELLEGVLKFNLDRVISKLKHLDGTVENAIERMYCRDEDLEKISHSNNTILIRQLVKYYPAIFNKHMLNFSEKFSDVVVHNIGIGRKRGFYREDFDALIYSKIFFQMIMSYDSSPYIDTEKIDREQYKNELMLMYMHAITTEKGRETLNKLKKDK